jgi:hypothetical protein
MLLYSNFDFNFAAAGDWVCSPDTTYTVNNIIGKMQKIEYITTAFRKLLH